MSKRAEEAARIIYYDGIQLLGRRDKNNNIIIRISNVSEPMKIE